MEACRGFEGQIEVDFALRYALYRPRIIQKVLPLSRANPMNGPAYVISLRNALERRPASEYQSPPRTGGTQVSIRLDEFIFNHVEAITARTGWNRAEVLNALIQRGLFDLYEFSSPAVIDALVLDVSAKLAPNHPPVNRHDS